MWEDACQRHACWALKPSSSATLLRSARQPATPKSPHAQPARVQPTQPPHPRFQRPSTWNRRGSTTPFGATQLIWTREVKRTWGGCRAGGVAAAGGSECVWAGEHAMTGDKRQPAAYMQVAATLLLLKLHHMPLLQSAPGRGIARRSKFSACKCGHRAQSAASKGQRLQRV